MKLKPNRLLSVLMALVLLLGLIPANASAATSAHKHVISADAELITLFDEEVGAPTYTDVCYFSDDWFLEDSSVANPHLATLTAIVGGVSFSDDTDVDGAKIRALLEALGFSDVELNAYYRQGITLEDSIGCAVARKTLMDGRNEYTLLAVCPRNAGYHFEWAGNFKLGTGGIHQGFLAARDEILRFMKSYIGDNGITGRVKVWCPGYSRGAAAANLLGGFLAEDSAYFGDGVSISPEDVFVYTIGTPVAVRASGVTRAEALSVAGARSGVYADHDTAGEAFVYREADAGETIDPTAEQYGGIHCYAAYGDFMTMLPPEDWGYTVYGSTEMISFGSEDMLAWLSLLSEKTAAAFKDKDYRTELPMKTLDIDTMTMCDTVYKIAPDAMIRGRLAQLMNMFGSPEAYLSEGGQAVLSSAGVLYGADWSAFYQGILGAGTGTLVKTGVLNYLASALERQRTDDPALTDDEGVAAVAIQLMGFLGKPAGDAEGYSAQRFLADLLDLTVNDGQSEASAAARWQLIASLLPDAYAPLYLSVMEYAKAKDIQARTADELLFLIASFVADNQSNPAVQALISILASLIPDDFSDMLLWFLSESIDDYAPTGVREEILDLIGGCVNGFPAGEDHGETAPEEVRSFLLLLLSMSVFDESDAISALLAGSEEPIELASLAADILDLILKDDDGGRVAVADAADAALIALLDQGRTQLIGDYLDVLTEKPAVLRRVLAALLFQTEGAYGLEKDICSAVTFVDMFRFLLPAHGHEMYLCFFKTGDSLYSMTGPEDEPEPPPPFPPFDGFPPYRPEPPAPAESRFDEVDPAKGGSMTNFKAEGQYAETMFGDVDPEAWYAESVRACVEFGLMLGLGDGSFGVGESLKVSEALAIADRLHNIYYGGSGVFDQTEDTPWYRVYEDYAVRYGLIRKGEYVMTAPITRRQFAAIISAALPDEALEPINEVSALPDVSPSDPDFAAIVRLYRAGILNGVDARGSFLPDAAITREQVAAIITRVADPALRKTFTLKA